MIDEDATMDHHYIPASLIGEWACADAWQLEPNVNRQRDLRAKDARSMNARRRKRPICVQSKSTVTFERSSPKDVFCSTDFYAIHPVTDPLDRALTVMMFQNTDGVESPTDEASFMAMADRYVHDRAEKYLAETRLGPPSKERSVSGHAARG